MKRHLIILSVLCLTAMTLRAQDTTAVRKNVRICQNCECGCHQHPVNDYEGLNSLRQRLANPSWDGKAELFRSIGTGMKIEDGKILPLSKKIESTDVISPVTSSTTSAQGNASLLKPYLQQMEKGEVPIGAPVFIFFRLAGTYVTDTPQLLSVKAAANLAIAQNLRVRITGAADSATGSADKNTALATARAEHVAKLFKERGVPVERIEVRSEGGITAYEPVSANRNCRVELFMQ
ncbi:MAG: OmpA family protein [Bacteroidales bacterium]|nr:OmpA family protein [Bacteroidales bacterium]